MINYNPSDEQRKLLETLNNLETISSKDVRSLLAFAKEAIDPNITCCVTCGDQVRRLVNRIASWWEVNRKMSILWDVTDADELLKVEVPTDILTCIHCKKEVKRYIYNRFHGTNCKLNVDRNG